MAAGALCRSVDHRGDETSQLCGRHVTGFCPVTMRLLGMDCAVAQRKFGARRIAQVHCIHFSYVRQVLPAAFLNVSTPVSALATTAWALPGCSFAENDPALGQIVGRHLDMYAVSNDRSDTVATHLVCSVTDQTMLIIEGDAETSVGQDLVDLTLHRNELFLRQSVSLAYEKTSARTYSVAEPWCMKRKWCRSRA